MNISKGERPLESGVRTDFRDAMSYGSYLRLDLILGAQQPLSAPAHHDEMLFIIQHQTSELWLKLMLHELRAARDLLDADQLSWSLKRLARVKRILETMTEQWSVLATMTPSEYAEFRTILGPSSGFQSYQYRAVEFMLGNKNADMLAVFEADPPAHETLHTLLEEPSLYDAFLRMLARRGYAIPADLLDRDVRQAWVEAPDLIPVFEGVYDDPAVAWDVYEACEDLVDLEDAFQFWRFRHLRTVQRMIGTQPGTGGSSGVPFLRRALDLTFFPELYSVRARIGG
ncbi:tryptophan 2,3-dioxygenase [Cryptosporangium aurantiacum]|uniref:Tryptophan 2,3-dioxygenase n=2 Tax=Cryptosporangium aurantiacum TaxID=134849 RepID=A0A1M7RG68_9ACTN|nr:tryptophan 2,3-dioxygenase family protein [Cryptosporangium aurantiacum]SHN45297.1 tryptophan 2,3-dioxygenase [Cryptosporangium aurantiacum]